jgi:predicted 2-oxoglutarate/Fe(II)-dependent dioxygenase YbiX
MLNKSLKDYILVFENVISSELCDAVLNEYANSDEWVDTEIGEKSEINKEIRNANKILISHPHSIEKNKETRLEIDRSLFASFASAIGKYRQVFEDCKIGQDSGYELLRYKEGQFYSQHTDHFSQAPRLVSCSFALNDDYEGGEWGFFDREMIIKAPKGAAVLFPSNFMYPHEIMPVTKGTRYSVITWFI